MDKKISLIIKLIISAGIIYYIFTIIPFSNIVESLTSVKLSYVLIALLIIMPTMTFLTSLQMKVLTHKQRLSLSVSQILEINFITSFYNLFLPGYLSGGVIRWYKFSKSDGKPAEALASIVYNRFFNTLVIVIVGFLFWMLDNKARSNYFIGITLIILILGLLVFYFLVFNKNMTIPLNKYINHTKLIPELVKNKLIKSLKAIYDFHDLSLKNTLYIFVLSIVSNILGILSFYLFALSIEINITFINLGWIRSFILLILMLPVSFSGLGVREGGLIVMLQNYAVSPVQAVALSFLLFGRTLFVGGIGGVLEARRLFFQTAMGKTRKKIS